MIPAKPLCILRRSMSTQRGAMTPAEGATPPQPKPQPDRGRRYCAAPFNLAAKNGASTEIASPTYSRPS